MYPENNQPLPSNYLDQIAPVAPKKSFLNLGKPILIGLIAIIVLTVICAVGLIVSISSSGKTTEKLAARLVTTKTIATDATDNIKSSSLRAVNGELKTFLTNTIRDIEPLLAKENTDIKSLPETLLNTKTDKALATRLEDARLNVIFDRTYAREMAYELSNILNLMQQIYSKTGNSDLKTFLDDAENNLTPIQKQFADFNTIDS